MVRSSVGISWRRIRNVHLFEGMSPLSRCRGLNQLITDNQIDFERSLKRVALNHETCL